MDIRGRVLILPSEPLLDTALLEKLERLTIHWQKSLPGLVGGHNTSRFAGPGQEFLDHRHFHQGDDLRAVNWRVYLRLEKLFLKMFQLEPRIPVRLLIDTSRSMLTGETIEVRLRAKAGRGAVLRGPGAAGFDLPAAVFGQAGRRVHRQRRTPSLSAGGEFSVRRFSRGGKPIFWKWRASFVSKYPQRGLVIVISDFLDDGDCEKPLQFLSDFGHELILVHVWAPEDREPPWEGELELEDAETGQHAELSFDADARAMYTAGVRRILAGSAPCGFAQRWPLRGLADRRPSG